MAEWYYLSGGQQNGPVTGTQLKSLAASGGLTADDLVWNQSMAEWAPAKRVKGLFAAHAVAPKPHVAAHAAAPAEVAHAPEQTYEAPPEQAPADQPHEAYAPAPAAPAQSLGYATAGGPVETVSDQTIQRLRQIQHCVRI